VPRISFFEATGDEDGFLQAWRAARAPLRATLLRSMSEHPEFRFAELAGDDAPRPELPGRVTSAGYVAAIDDLPDGRAFECVWVNAYEVPPEEEEAFMTAWTGVRDTVKGKPGYIGSRLHRAEDPDAAFRFVNVAPWETVDAFTAAVATPAFAGGATAIYHQAHPALFEVVG
jgi:heme-degrading monooxygenase HmoA